jgi:hypothetical protein
VSAAQTQKRSAVGSDNPSLNPVVLQNVFSYVGLGHCLFMAPVSLLWRDMYATLEGQQLTVREKFERKRIITCIPQVTLYRSVFTSPSRVKLAHESGLDCTSEAYQRAAGKHADIAILARAHELGMQYTATTIYSAAECNKLAEVQYLHWQGCPWPLFLLEIAARGGFFELLR